MTRSPHLGLCDAIGAKKPPHDQPGMVTIMSVARVNASL
jgi:hypothetical protein